MFPKAAEITLEANPEDVTLEKMIAYQKLGINRVSIGVQSLDDPTLYSIGRGHTSNRSIEAIYQTWQAGITNISIDLMYDLPNQEFPSWKKTIDRVLSLPITHLSLYNLTLELGSLYHKKQISIAPLMPHDEESAAMLSYAIETLTRGGFNRYEISAFCKENLISNHNLGYWTGRPFIGLGPSAFSYYGGSRLQNTPHLSKWKNDLLQGSLSFHFEETLPHPANLHELLAIGLRVSTGIDITAFPTLPRDTLNLLTSLTERGLLSCNETRYALTPKGQLFYDDVASEIV